jgi:hypothetical protein
MILMMRLITDKRTQTFTAWRHKGDFKFSRDDRYQRIAGHCLNLVVPEKTKVTKTKTAAAIKQEPYIL